MIKIRRNPDLGTIVAVLACDHCGQEITHAGKALYHWRMQEGEPVEDSLRIYHKRPCSDVIERGERVVGQQPAGRFYWSELSTLPGLLVTATNFSWVQLIHDCPDEQLDQVLIALQARIAQRDSQE